MGGKEMLLGSVKEALSYNANTFMFYTGAPQNTRRKPVSELRVEEAKELMKEKGIDMDKVVVHAPYRKLKDVMKLVQQDLFFIQGLMLKQGMKQD